MRGGDPWLSTLNGDRPTGSQGASLEGPILVWSHYMIHPVYTLYNTFIYHVTPLYTALYMCIHPYTHLIHLLNILMAHPDILFEVMVTAAAK